MQTHRIDATFSRLQSARQKAFVAYLTAGDPSPEQTPALVEALAEAGADIIELGIPFSDPIADGPVIQQAFQRALAHGTSVASVLEMVRAIRQRTEVPIVLFTYFNPVMRYGQERFLRDAASAGADGVLLLDLPPEEGSSEANLCAEVGLRWIRLIAPTTPDERAARLAREASGFVYYVSRAGVTGMQDQVASTIGERVTFLQQHTRTPICVGFGVANPDHVRQIARDADGIVVGSAIVRQIEQYAGAPDLVQRVKDFVRPLAEAAHGQNIER
jgi:tryptophan synthase alpha chain